MIIRVLSVFIIILVSYSNASGGNFSIGMHSGYGVLKYEEQSSAFGRNRKSESAQNIVVFGISGEYSFPERENLYAGIVTDWVRGLKDEETWRDNGAEFQTNDMKFFGQFYDFRFGYKNSLGNFYYSFYISGGWDGLHFKRDNFVTEGVADPAGTVSEDFSLWRTGTGTGLGYRFGKWTLGGRAAYNYYPAAEVDNSSLPQFTFNTSGTCLDMGFGVGREISKNTSFYAGGSYTLLELDQSDIMRSGSIQAIFPDSKTEIMFGVMSLTYAF